MKKLAILFVALALCMGLAVPAFAAERSLWEDYYSIECDTVKVDKDNTFYYAFNGTVTSYESQSYYAIASGTPFTVTNVSKDAAVSGQPTKPATASNTDAQVAYASTQSVLVDGKPVTFEAYALKDENGYDTNYIKLRDVAYILNGTTAQFQVGWDGAVNILTGQAYTSNGSEMSTPYSGNRAYTMATAETKVNGKAVPLEAILLQDDSGNGYTYYKLRDLGAALNFTVDWTAEKGIFIETPASEAGPTLANGKPITDDNIREIIYALKAEYPEGMHWTNDDSYYSAAVHMTGFGCVGFALICSDAAFGSLPVTSTHSNFDSIKVGDMLRINNNTHSVIVLEKRANSVIVAEGNYNSSIHWGREISRQTLVNGNFTATSRYPQ